MPLRRCNKCGKASKEPCQCWATQLSRCPRCGTPVRGHCQCSERKREQAPQRQSNKKLYNSKRWKDVRKLVLLRDGYQCQQCNKLVTGYREAQVDHIRDLADGGEQVDMENLQTLCSACHGAKTVGGY